MRNKIHIPISNEELQSLAKIDSESEAHSFLQTWYGIDPTRIEKIETVGTNVGEPVLIISIKYPR
jgi:hypothetical protein